MKFAKGAFLCAVVGWGALVNFYLSAHLICVDCIDPLAILNHAAHYLTLSAVIVFIIAFIFRANKWVLVWLLPGVFAFALWYGQNFLPKPEPKVDGIEITAASYNVLGHLAHPNQTFAVINEMDADIVALQELRPTLGAKLRVELSEKYPYQVSEILQVFDGLALLSKFPIVESQIELADDLSEVDLAKPRYIRAVLDVYGQAVVVYAFHAAYPPFGIPFYYDDSDQKATIYSIVRLIKQETLPVLLLCDCNLTPRTPQYGILNEILDDSFQEQGWGFGLTHPSKYYGRFRKIRIDYLWHSEEFETIYARVWPDSGTSDHHPIWGQFILRKDEEQ